MSAGEVIIRQAAIGEICVGVPKSALCGALVPSVGGFERGLPAVSEFSLLKALKGAILAAKPLESGECRLRSP
jgi:hypothetical protein